MPRNLLYHNNLANAWTGGSRGTGGSRETGGSRSGDSPGTTFGTALAAGEDAGRSTNGGGREAGAR